MSSSMAGTCTCSTGAATAAHRCCCCTASPAMRTPGTRSPSRCSRTSTCTRWMRAVTATAIPPTSTTPPGRSRISRASSISSACEPSPWSGSPWAVATRCTSPPSGRKWSSGSSCSTSARRSASARWRRRPARLSRRRGIRSSRRRGTSIAAIRTPASTITAGWPPRVCARAPTAPSSGSGIRRSRNVA